MTNRGKLLVLQLGALGAAAILVRQPVTNHPIDWRHLSGWLRSATPETVVAEAGRLLLIGAAAWLAVITALAWFAFVAGTFDAVARITPRFVRRLIEGAFAASIVATALAPTAALATDRPRIVAVSPVRDGRSPAEPIEEPTGLTIAPEPEAAPAPAPAPAPDPAPIAHPGTIHVVQRGESLWSIAHDASAGMPADRSTDGYWHALCDANRARLPSGDVNLVYPGDEVILP